MQKMQLNSFKPESLIHSGDCSKIYTLEDGRVLKVAAPLV